MKFQNKYFVSAILVFTLLAGWVTPAYAATVISITPTSILNDIDRTITVTGTDLTGTAVVLLDGTPLVTVPQDPQTLTATVPAKTDIGPHIITVTLDGVPLSPSFSLYITNEVVVPPTLTPTPAPFGRPQMVIKSYKANTAAVEGQEFRLNIGFDNSGKADAYNTQAAFASPDLVPTKTGGVVSLGSVSASGHKDIEQRFLALDSVSGKSVVVIDVTLTYYDDKGTPYSDKFTLSVPAQGYTGGGVAYATATPTGVNSAQLVIVSYTSTVDPLQPGDQFQLGLTVQNTGNTNAKRVTMIVGGGSTGSGGGTPQAGGISGGSGEFTTFAPVDSSNVQSLGDLGAGEAMQVTQKLIVNVSAVPGVYPMKISFSYVAPNGDVVNDDQVITFLIYSLPNVDISFYRVPDPFFAGQPGSLPIQIVNLGKRNSVLGSMKVEAAGGTVDPSSTLVGSLDPGGYFTFDSTLFPDAAGPMQLTFTIDYTDDFNQPHVITKTLDITVEEMMIDPLIDPSQGGGGGGEVVVDETFLHKVWRFIKGLFGLDSAAPSNGVAPGIEPGVPDQQFIPVPSGGKG
ncbi:MAG: IPT/TIG domain-containing protein [Chloroflexi bacterium]|nr:IPT/TIG domain-containing protein [Chloroflexota bacterium]